MLTYNRRIGMAIILFLLFQGSNTYKIAITVCGQNRKFTIEKQQSVRGIIDQRQQPEWKEPEIRARSTIIDDRREWAEED